MTSAVALAFSRPSYYIRWSELLDGVARSDVDVPTAFEEEALLVGVELRVTPRGLDSIVPPQDAVGTDGM